jgi:hypothetical protein
VDTASLISASKMRSDCGDVRFTDSDAATLLSYWIEPDTCNTATTRIWVRVPSIPASSTRTIYMYYGNPTATSASNGTAVFLLFSDWGSAKSQHILQGWVCVGRQQANSVLQLPTSPNRYRHDFHFAHTCLYR